MTSRNAPRTLVRGAWLLTLDRALGNFVGDLLIEDGRIQQVAPRLEIDETALMESGGTVIDGRGRIVIPGFVDAHRHLFQALLRGVAADWSLFQYFTAMFGLIAPQMKPDQLALGTTLGALDALDSGVTTVFDYSHNQSSPEHTDAMIGALRGSGIRAIFGYGGSMTEQLEILAPPFKSATPSDAAEIKRVRAQHFTGSAELVTMGLAIRGPDSSTMEVVRDDLALGRELDVPITTHIGMAALDLDGRPHVTRMAAEGLLGPDLTFAHCNLLTDAELAAMADTGVAAVVTPEDEAAMGHGWAPISRLLAAGIRPNIGIDTCMAVGGDPFTAMRMALAVARGTINQPQIESGANPWHLDIHAQDVLELATLAGAEAVGLGHLVGSITPGKQADLVILDARDLAMVPLLDPVAAVVQHAGRRNVETVLVAGVPVKTSGELLRTDLPELLDSAQQEAERVLADAGITPGWAPPPPEVPDTDTADDAHGVGSQN